MLPVATLLEKLGFQQGVEETLRVKRVTRAMTLYQFVLAMVLALYGGFWRLHPLRFLQRDPMRVGILKVLGLPPQCTFWRFRASLHLQIAQQLLVNRPIFPHFSGRWRRSSWEATAILTSSAPVVNEKTPARLLTLSEGHRGARQR